MDSWGEANEGMECIGDEGYLEGGSEGIGESGGGGSEDFILGIESGIVSFDMGKEMECWADIPEI